MQKPEGRKIVLSYNSKKMDLKPQKMDLKPPILSSVDEKSSLKNQNEDVPSMSEKLEISKNPHESFELLQSGVSVIKIGHNGTYRTTKIWLGQGQILGEWRVYWASKNKKNKNSLVIQQCALVEGLCGKGFDKTFLQKTFATKKHLAFSVVSSARSLDVVVDNSFHYDCWIYELKRLGIWDDEKYSLYEQESNDETR